MNLDVKPPNTKSAAVNNATEPAIGATGLRFAYHSQIVVNLDQLRLEYGESMAIMGPSGSGKTTLLHLLAGLITPNAGSIHLLGQPLAEMNESARDRFRGKHIGFVFQRLHLLPALTVSENITLAAQLAGQQADADRRNALLAALQLEDLGDRRPSSLSRGQAQRVAIARAIIHRPQLLIADEPTSALDEKNADAVMNLLQKSAREANASLLVVTHDQRIRGRLDREFDIGTAP